MCPLTLTPLCPYNSLAFVPSCPHALYSPALACFHPCTPVPLHHLTLTASSPCATLPLDLLTFCPLALLPSHTFIYCPSTCPPCNHPCTHLPFYPPALPHSYLSAFVPVCPFTHFILAPHALMPKKSSNIYVALFVMVRGWPSHSELLAPSHPCPSHLCVLVPSNLCALLLLFPAVLAHRGWRVGRCKVAFLGHIQRQPGKCL